MNDSGFVIQFNKLQSIGQIPEWVCCQLEGNDMLETTLYGVEAESISCVEDYQLDWEVSPSAGNSLVVKSRVQTLISPYPVSSKFDSLQDVYVMGMSL